MKITENFLTVNKFSRPGIKLEKVTKIAVHYVGNPGSSAIANRNYFENQKNGGTYVSAHFVIGLRGRSFSAFRWTNGLTAQIRRMGTAFRTNAVTRTARANSMRKPRRVWQSYALIC